MSATGHVEDRPLVAELGDLRQAVVARRWTLHSVVAYGVADWLEISGQIPFVLTQSGEDAPGSPVAPVPSQAGFGTPWLGFRGRVLREAAGRPLDLAAGLQVGFPIGQASLYTKPASTVVIPALELGKRLGRYLHLGLELGANVHTATSQLLPGADNAQPAGTELWAHLGASSTTSPLRGELAFRSGYALASGRGAVELLGGVRFGLGNTELYVLGGAGGGTLVGTPGWRLLAGIAWGGVAPAPLCVAGQPAAPQDCPLLDADRDGIANGVDSCPLIAGPNTLTGCPLQDADGDGIEDADDACPSRSGGAAAQGCPVADKDGDGVHDAEDACPEAAGLWSRGGCPLLDLDLDGIEDSDDACPKVAGPTSNKGCPGTDADGDGLDDGADNCPQDAGPKQNQGCPPTLPQHVALFGEQLTALEPMPFTSGGAALLPHADVLLDDVVQLLARHPELPPLEVRCVALHRKSPPDPQLALARAQAVRARLVAKGVQAGRLGGVQPPEVALGPRTVFQFRAPFP